MKPFVTVYGPHAPEQFHNGLMWSWNRDQRDTKERNVSRFMGHDPVVRINIKPRLRPGPERQWGGLERVA